MNLATMRRLVSDCLQFRRLLDDQDWTISQQISVFALLALGITEPLAGGAITASDAIRLFFNGENCRYIRKSLRNAVADEVMSRGVQLPDLFEALPAEEANREFRRELETIRTLCLKLLNDNRMAA